MKRRINALKNLQVKCAHIEAKFYEEVHELERKYAALYQPLFDKVRPLYSLLEFLFNFISLGTQAGADGQRRHKHATRVLDFSISPPASD